MGVWNIASRASALLQGGAPQKKGDHAFLRDRLFHISQLSEVVVFIEATGFAL